MSHPNAPDTMSGLRLIRQSSQMASVLHPLRRAVLVSLREPGSAAAVAERLGVSRQKVNYHVRQLEDEGLLEEIAETRRGNCVERTMRPSASHYLVSPAVLGELAATSGWVGDRASSEYLLAVLARALEEVAELHEEAEEGVEETRSVALETRLRFPDASAREAFARDMARAVTEVIRRHHRPEVDGGVDFRLVMAGYGPGTPPDPTTDDQADRP